MQLRRDKGLCYYCDEKFSFKHKCPNKHLLLLQVDDEPPLEPEIDPPDEPPPIEDVTQSLHHISLNAMAGASGVGVIRFIRHVADLTIQILVDGGRSDNFLQPHVAHFLHLPVEPAPPFNVLVGNGQTMEHEGRVQNFAVTIQGHLIQVPVFLLSISNADLVLGSTWLATLGPHIVDYDFLCLKFYYQDQFITLRGDKPTQPLPSHFHHLRRMNNTKSIDEFFALQVLPHDNSQDPPIAFPLDMEPELKQLLMRYYDVFQKPIELPPPREQNHSIPLLQGSDPVKVRPYRYPHSQKEQIEKMVQEMLEQGLIQPSNNPFSSPIILVKKKDRTW